MHKPGLFNKLISILTGKPQNQGEPVQGIPGTENKPVDTVKSLSVKPTTYKFILEPDWWWIINPPTDDDEIELAIFIRTEKIIFSPDGQRVRRPISLMELAIREITLTFGGTNIPGVMLDEFSSKSQIETVLSKMPRNLVMELWYAVGKAVPHWGPDDTWNKCDGIQLNQGRQKGEFSVGLHDYDRQSRSHYEDDDCFDWNEYQDDEEGYSLEEAHAEDSEIEELFFSGFFDPDNWG